MKKWLEQIAPESKIRACLNGRSYVQYSMKRFIILVRFYHYSATVLVAALYLI